MKKGLILSLLLIVTSVIILSFTYEKKSLPVKPTAKLSSASTGITCRQWCSHENTWADMWALAAWDAQMQAEAPQEMRAEDSWDVSCGVASPPGCVLGTCIQICYGSFP